MPRRATLLLPAFLALTVVGCAPGPALTPTPGAGSSTGTAASASATATNGQPSASATAHPTACPVAAQTGLLPSDRLVDLAISSTSTQDLVTFVFAPSTPGPGGPPRGALDGAQPPFSHAGSGLPIDLLGEHAVQVRFTGMTVASETGDAVYTGPPDVEANLPALREAIQYDASEGVVGWYIGYDGPGCVTLIRNGNEVTVAITHPGAPPG
jgi:hypothetical protein